jgi:hypothetical protein
MTGAMCSVRWRSQTRVFLAASLCVLSCARSSASDDDVLSYGDPSLRAAVDARSRPIYEAAAKPDAKRVFLMTLANPLSLPGAQGTEATGVVVEGAFGRIVVKVWTKRGQYSVEYYRTPEALLFVYETFVYFAERAPRRAWRNFMGLPAWERRSYFDERNRIGFAEARGKDAPSPGSGGRRLIAQADRVTKLVQERFSQDHSDRPEG